MGIFGPPNIEKMKANKDVKGLTKAMRYQKDQRVRREAVLAMAELGKGAVAPLIAALGKDINFTERKVIVQSLGKIGAPAIEPLIAVLKEITYRSEYYEFERVELAADALGEIGDVRAVEPLIYTLRNAYDRRPDASNPISFSPYVNDWTKAVRLSVGRALLKIGEPAVEQLIEALEARPKYNQSTRATIVWVLGEIGDRRAVDVLVDIVRYRIYQMEKWGLTSDADVKLTLVAAYALAKIGDPRAVEPMIDILQKNMYSIAIPLSNLGGSKSLEAIVGIIGGRDGGSWTVQDVDCVVQAMCNFGESALEELNRSILKELNRSNNKKLEALRRVHYRVQNYLHRK